ncbi:hypothetical protein [Catellatospora methionotrophica]|uniref:hypothetical protein n=1 Tax=Catellatospora methionotrophica TaxID=121620 RepID=UPI0033DC8327
MGTGDDGPSWRTPALIAVSGGLFALVSGLAVNTVEIPAGWRPYIWLLTAVLLVGAVFLAVQDGRSGAAVDLAGIMRRPAVWLVAAVVAGFVLAALVLPGAQPAADPPADGGAASRTTPMEPSVAPSSDGPPSPTPEGSPSPTASPTAGVPSPAVSVRVRWHGLLVMDCCGGPGYSLDTVPPSGAMLGDVQGVGYAEIAGAALAEWTAATPPSRADCARRLNAVVGQRRLEVQVGSVACFQTRAGRVGHLTVVALSRPGALDSLTTKVEATVWDKA